MKQSAASLQWDMKASAAVALQLLTTRPTVHPTEPCNTILITFIISTDGNDRTAPHRTHVAATRTLTVCVRCLEASSVLRQDDAGRQTTRKRRQKMVIIIMTMKTNYKTSST